MSRETIKSLEQRQPLVERAKSMLFQILLLSSVGFSLFFLAVLLVDVLATGSSRIDLALITQFPSSSPELAGARSAIMGTIWVIGITAIICVPLGVGAAVYLEEYADANRWYNRAIELNIQNLAAVPSIVYGILGLGIIVRALGFGQTVIAAAFTLTLLVLPIMIIAAREALRAVPDSIRSGALALGATRWQTVRHQVLPAAVPGIATGAILSLSRAIGEAAPLILLGGLTFVTFSPSGLNSSFTVLPIQIFNWISRPQAEFHVLAAAAIVVLLAILLAMNGLAIYLRNRYQKRW